MIKNLLLLNQLGPVDVGFFIACAAIVVLIIAVYFLIPVFNKKQYQEQRDNLKKREDAFKSNKKTTVELNETVCEEGESVEVENETNGTENVVLDANNPTDIQ